MRFFRTLRELGDRVGRFPSMLFALTYLTAIPVFAVFYTLIPYDFYSSTARFEPILAAEKAAIADRMREAFLKDHVSAGDPPKLGEIEIEKSNDGVFPIFEIQPSADKVRILIMLKADTAPDFLLKIALDVDPYTTVQTTEQGFNAMGYVRVIPTTLSTHKLDLAKLFPCHVMAWTEFTCISMRVSDYSELLSLTTTEQGLPTRLQNSYLRMLYFSAVTMSTLGYGDIVPFTTRSRAIVTLQVILGPVFFGLFLNSVARERGP